MQSNRSFFSLMVCDFYIFKYILHHPEAMKVVSVYLFKRISFLSVCTVISRKLVNTF